ncbi:MAG: lipopolysaccharide biosynthesis protein [Verrucomicrobiae bacterium]|nr:lipopolysaccharide biosynthesis protein [Verrucomicrobiae bacterium]
MAFEDQEAAPSAGSGSARFFRSGGIYLGANLLNAALAFLLVPILTRHLSPVDYGVTATATVLIQILTMAISLNAYGLVYREYFTAARSTLSALLSTAVCLPAGLAALLTPLFFLGGPILERLTAFPASWAGCLGFLAFAQTLQNISLGMLQARSEAGRFGVWQILSSSLNLGLSILFVVGFGMDWRGRMLALVAVATLMSLAFAAELGGRLRLLRPRLERESLRALARFGLPLLPHFAGGWVMTMSPRLFLNHMSGLAETGLYSVAYNLASPLMILIGAANQAYIPLLFGKLSAWERAEGERQAASGGPRVGEPCSPLPAPCSTLPAPSSPLPAPRSLLPAHRSPLTDQIRFCRLLLLACAALPFAAVALWLGVRWILPWLVGPKFLACAPYVFWLALALAFNGIYYIFGNFVLYSKKTRLLSWRADFLGGLSTLVLCPLGIHFWGGVGAAAATAAAFAISCLGGITAACRAHPMPWGATLRGMLRGGDPRGGPPARGPVSGS